MCPPDFFGVRYVINPWMEGNVDRASQANAQRQWQTLHDRLAKLARIEIVPPDPNQPDMVFTANAGLALNGRVLLSRFRHDERQPECGLYRKWFEDAHLEVLTMPDELPFEGAGDALWDEARACVWAGYGLRTDLEAHAEIESAFGFAVHSLRLCDKRFYHLDTCFCPLPQGFVMYYPAAFDARSLRCIEERVPPDKRIPVGDLDARRFACNATCLADTVALNHATEALQARLRSAGFRVATIPVDEFMLAGGAVKCLTLRLDETAPTNRQSAPANADDRQRVVELSGHLLDAGSLNRALDVTLEAGGSFRVLEFELGMEKQSCSRAKIKVIAPDAGVLENVLQRLLPLGAEVRNGKDAEARTVAVSQDGVAPDDFYSTTIYPTQVHLGGRWWPVSRQRMDAVVVIDRAGPEPRAECRLLRELRRGDEVVVGHDGVRTRSRAEDRTSDGNDFEFMGAGVSSERRVELAVERIAWEMRRIRDRGGRIVVVAGPVVVHTGGGPHLARLIRQGYVSALLGGNAVAVHDMEEAVMGTSLGVDLKRGVPVVGGHHHHLRVINAVRRAGGIAKAVEQEIVTSGIMYECVRRDVPFSLAGSIRDDGPLPDTEMDLLRAQAEYARLVDGADMILMLSSMLHSIGVGNMTPAGVHLVCVDINPAVVTKLADRGSLESDGIVTDVGLFLNRLGQHLQDDEAEQPIASNETAGYL